MNLQALPHVLGILLAAGAFGVAWLVGVLSDVPLDRIALRAVIGAAVFWALGIVAGRIWVDGICEAMSDRLAGPHASDDKGQRRQS